MKASTRARLAFAKGDVVGEHSEFERRSRSWWLHCLASYPHRVDGQRCFSDEGTYVLAGTRILRNQDHMVPLWLDGSPYLFPLLSGAAYLAGGLEGSRVLTVFLYAVGVAFSSRFVDSCFDSRRSNEVLGDARVVRKWPIHRLRAPCGI